MKANSTILAAVLILLIFVVLACGEKKNPGNKNPEKDLIQFFTDELTRMREFQEKPDSYLRYLVYQKQNYPAKQFRLNKIIVQINAKFSALPDKDKMNYQREWKEKLQPIVNEIQGVMHQMVVRDTPGLNADKMAKIQQLTIIIKEQEKKAKREVLLPVFFTEPEL